MRRYGWHALLWALVLGAAVVAGGSTLRFPGRAAAIQTGALVATFLAAALYTLETRKLRLQQRLAEEIRRQPWISISKHTISRNLDEPASPGSFIIRFELSNGGLTPALRLRIRAGFKMDTENGPEQVLEQSVAALVPNDPVALIFLVKVSPPGIGLLNLRLRYDTLDGGTGELSSIREILTETGFRLRSSSYRLMLSTGGTL